MRFKNLQGPHAIRLVRELRGLRLDPSQPQLIPSFLCQEIRHLQNKNEFVVFLSGIFFCFIWLNFVTYFQPATLRAGDIAISVLVSSSFCTKCLYSIEGSILLSYLLINKTVKHLVYVT